MVLSSLETIWFLENPWPWSKDMEKGLKWSENTLQTCLKWITKSSFDSFLLKHMFKNCNFKIFENSVFFFKSMVIVNLVNFLSCKFFEGYKIPIVMRATDSWTQRRSQVRPWFPSHPGPFRRERRRPAEPCPDSSITFHWLKLYNDLIERLKRSFEFSEFSKQF